MAGERRGQPFLARHRMQAAVVLAVSAAVQSLDWRQGRSAVVSCGQPRFSYGRGFESSMCGWSTRAPKCASPPCEREDVFHPTVILRCHMWGPASWFGSWREARLLKAEADASLRPQGEY